MLFLFVFNVPLAEFKSMFWVIIMHEYKFLTHKPLPSKLDHVMLQYTVIASLIKFAIHLVQIHNFAIGKSSQHQNRASSMLYNWYDTMGCSSFPDSSSLLGLPIWLNDFELWLIGPKDFIPLLFCPVFVPLGQLEPFDIVLLPQQCFFWQQFCHIGQLHKVFSSQWLLT